MWKISTSAASLVMTLTVLASPPDSTNQDWSSYGLDHTERRFSSLTQVTRDSVAGLQLDCAFDVPNSVSINSTSRSSAILIQLCFCVG